MVKRFPEGVFFFLSDPSVAHGDIAKVFTQYTKPYRKDSEGNKES